MSETAVKIQRLASAIYLITGFFSDLEPLKWRLRGLSTDLVSESIRDKNAIVREISSVISLAKNAGLVSEPNHEIISQELSKISNDLERPMKIPVIQESVPRERALPQPQEVERIKDNLPEFRTQDRPDLKDFGAVSVKKNSRQSVIIGLLKRKKEIMIKDVSPLIDGVSEKTIQRELLAMVQAGILTKKGEKRWSRYSLA